jgi:small conductance mechanosensitive channel
MQTLEDTLSSWIHPELMPIVLKVVGLALILLAGVAASIVIAFVMRRIQRSVQSAAFLERDTRGEYAKRITTLLTLLKTILITVNWVIVVVTMLSHAGLDITPILASAGILGLAVGFGAQNLVRDVISGFFHILENQVRVGDVVKINGVGGLVEQITYRIIVLRDLEQAVHIFPHGKVETLTNLTKDVSAMVLDVGVAYGEHPDRVTGALRDVAAAMSGDPDWRARLLEPLEVMGLEAFADSAVLYRVRYMTLPIEQWNVKREFQRRIKIEFDRRGIEFPFPHRTLYVAEGSAPLAVRLLPGEEGGEEEGEAEEEIAVAPKEGWE